MRRGLRRRTIALQTAVICVLIAASSALAGGSVHGRASQARSNSQAQAKLRIAYVLPDLSNPFEAGLAQAAEAQAKKDGVALYVKSSNDASTQANAALALIGAKVNAIALHAVDGKVMAGVVKKANQAHVPVVSTQNPIAGKVATFVGADNYAAGLAIGQSIADYCWTRPAPCNLGIIEGNLASPSGLEENKGVRDYIRKHATNIKIVGEGATNYDPAAALNVATNLLTAHPNLNYFYSWWDQGAESAIHALASKNLVGKVGIAGFGGTCQNMTDLIKGKIQEEIVFFPQIQGAEVVKALELAARGKHQPADTSVPTLSVNTALANAWLAGDSKPPTQLRPYVMKLLRQAKSGTCPK